jgi:hypothetical protein
MRSIQVEAGEDMRLIIGVCGFRQAALLNGGLRARSRLRPPATTPAQK